jgi:TatD DNase family protein
MLIDTHAHLNFPDFKKDLDQVIKRSTAAGVKKIICVSSNLADSKRAIEISQKYPNIVYAAIGIHPQQTDPQNSTSLIDQIKELEKLATENKVIAVGECGLDFSPAPPPELDRTPENQIFLFKEQIKIAQKLNLPISIHSRKSFSETIEVLSGFSNIRGVVHCYSGGKKGIEKVKQLGLYFGVDGNLTYDGGLQGIFKLIPLERIVLETDCPFLAPIPYRGQRSEPVYTKIIAETLAKIKRESFEKVAQNTTASARQLFLV